MKFAVGMVVVDKKNDLKGVIISWDAQSKNTDEWEQPLYNIRVETCRNVIHFGHITSCKEGRSPLHNL